MPTLNPFDPSIVSEPEDAFDAFDTDASANKSGHVLLRNFALTGQIITLALAKGSVIIGLIFGVLLMDDQRQVENAEILLPIGGGVLVMALVTAFFLSKMLRSRNTGRLREHPEVVAMRDDGTSSSTTSQALRDQWVNWDAKTPLPRPLRSFLGNEQTATLVGQAILEGSTVINLVFALLDGSFGHFVFAFVAWVGLISMIPTIGKLRARIDTALTPDTFASKFAR